MQLSEYIVMTERLASTAELAEIAEVLSEVAWKKAKTFSEVEDYRTCTVFSVSDVISGRQPVAEPLRKRLRRIDSILFKVVGAARVLYQQRFPRFQSERDAGYDFLRYERGQFYREHTDRSARFPRLLSLSLGLNDDYEGGEFAFFDGALELRLGAGCAIMFPSNFMYPHAIKPVTAGTRYSMVTWFI